MMAPFRPIALAMCLAPSALFAQSPSGSITGTLDLEDAVWQVTDTEGLPSSGFTEVDGGYRVTLVGYPDRAADDRDGALELAFTATGDPTEIEVVEASLRYLSAGDGTDHVAEGQNIDLSLTALEVGGDEMALSGSLAATMTPGSAEDLVIEDEYAITFDGNFQATVGRAD